MKALHFSAFACVLLAMVCYAIAFESGAAAFFILAVLSEAGFWASYGKLRSDARRSTPAASPTLQTIDSPATIGTPQASAKVDP